MQYLIVVFLMWLTLPCSSFLVGNFRKKIVSRMFATNACTTFNSSICGGVYSIVTPGTFITSTSDILPQEIEFVNSVEHLKSRQDIFLCGRIALRRSIRALGLDDASLTDLCLSTPILRNQLGAPVLPNGISGSISHKNHYAVGVARSNIHESLGHWSDHLSDKETKRSVEYGNIGIDIEKCTNKAFSALSERLLTDNEQSHLNSRKNHSLTTEENVMLRFSFKEAIFKALNPVLKRYVDFSEMEVYPQDDGTAILNFCLRSGELFEYQAEYKRWSPEPGCDYWITCVYMYHMHRLKCS